MKHLVLMFFVCLIPTLALAGSRKDAEEIALNASYIPLVGEWEVRVNEPFADVVAGFESAMGKLDYTLTKEKRSEGAVVLTFRGAEDVKVTLKLKEIEDYTNVKIFYGRFGSEEESRELFVEAYTRF